MFTTCCLAVAQHDWTAHTTAVRGHVYPVSTGTDCVRLPSTYDSQAQIVRYAVEVTSLVSDKGVRVWGRGWGRVRVM